MKKSIIGLATALLLMTVLPVASIAGTETANSKKNNKTESPELRLLVNRLHEIKAIDRSELQPEEKLELRNEVKEIKKEIKASGGGVYLSIGALLLVIILLIILL
jgi:hypothetical protein